MSIGQKEFIMNLFNKLFFCIKKYFYIKKIKKQLKSDKYIY
jgi:hypothetical protein